VVSCGERCRATAYSIGIEKAMSASDHKACWDLLETLHWIGTRDKGRLTAMGEIEEGSRPPLAMLTADAVLDWHQLLPLVEYDFKGDHKPAECQAGRKSLDANESSMLRLGQSLNYLLQQVHIRRIRMEAIKCDMYSAKLVPVSPADLNDLEFRVTLDHQVAKVGLWSRSRNELMWRSPKFLRADVIRVWPARKKKLAQVSELILRHLRTIMNPAAPLTRADAQRHCLAEVRGAYPEAFEKAWGILDPSCKRARGQSGGRTQERGLPIPRVNCEISDCRSKSSKS